MTKVNFEDLEPSDDYLTMLYKGRLFNGIAVENDDQGRELSLTTFVDGQQNGLRQEWSINGRLLREQFLKTNALHGVSREWYENGQIMSDGVYELGICLKEKRWSKNGVLEKDYVICNEDPQFEILQRLRELY